MRSLSTLKFRLSKLQLTERLIMETHINIFLFFLPIKEISGEIYGVVEYTRASNLNFSQ